MKIFSPPSESARVTETGTKHTGPKGRKKAAPAPKAPVSETEIREKLAAHVETSNTAKAKTLQKNTQQLGAGFMNSDVPPPPKIEQPVEEKEKTDSVKESHLLMSDVKLNDPKDTNTQEKLKTVLSTGAFNFNPKEKDALDRILNG